MKKCTNQNIGFFRLKIWLITILIAAVIFLLDMSLPLGVAGGVPYVVLFFLSWWYRSIKFVIALGVIASLLTMVGFFLSESGAVLWMVLINRFYAILAIWMTASILVIAIRARNAQAEQLDILSKREQELVSNRHRQKLQFENTPLASVEWNNRFEVVDWNFAAEKMFGYSKADVIGRHINTHILPIDFETADLVGLVWDNILRNSGGRRSINFNRTKKGERIICSWYNSSLIDNDGKVIGVTSIAEDITERQLALQKEQTEVKVLSMLSNEEPLKEILNTLVIDIEQQIPNVKGSILLLSDDGKRLVKGAMPNLPSFYCEAINGIEVSDNVGSCCTAVYRRERVIVENIATHSFWVDYRDLAKKANLGSCWSEPIINTAGELLGAFALYSDHPSKPSAADISIIESISKLAAMSIDKARTIESNAMASLVFENSREGIMVVDGGNIVLSVNPSFEKITGYNGSEIIGLTPVILQSKKTTKEFYQGMWKEINETGHWQGELWNSKKDGTVYLQLLDINTIFNEDGSIYRRIAIFSDITKVKEVDDIVWRHSNYDALTGLPNRSLFLDHLQRVCKKTEDTNRRVALLSLDIDHFKDVNDQVGHNLGDEMLKIVADRIKSCVSSADMVSRLGGDEFTITIEGPFHDEEIDRIGREILENISRPFFSDVDIVYVTASVGIAFYPNDCAGNVDELLSCADQAMYAVKGSGRADLNYYTLDIQQKALSRVNLIGELREAIKENQFTLNYQPIVNLRDNSVCKAEALIRWENPQKGFVSPEEFIPITEETGMIVEIGDWVMREAARSVKKWRASVQPNMQVSINVSPIQFQDKANISDIWLSEIEQLGLPGESLVLEITEGLLMENPEDIIGELKNFHDSGISISLDDFGTGYSSLSYLKKFDMDFLKIDRSFVMSLTADSDDLALCEAIIVMAHKLNMKVIAEGIETDEQRQLLTSAGCDFGQGYFFSKPMPQEEFELYLADTAESGLCPRQIRCVM